MARRGLLGILFGSRPGSERNLFVPNLNDFKYREVKKLGFQRRAPDQDYVNEIMSRGDPDRVRRAQEQGFTRPYFHSTQNPDLVNTIQRILDPRTSVAARENLVRNLQPFIIPSDVSKDYGFHVGDITSAYRRARDSNRAKWWMLPMMVHKDAKLLPVIDSGMHSEPVFWHNNLVNAAMGGASGDDLDAIKEIMRVVYKYAPPEGKHGVPRSAEIRNDNLQAYLQEIDDVLARFGYSGTIYNNQFERGRSPSLMIRDPEAVRFILADFNPSTNAARKAGLLAGAGGLMAFDDDDEDDQ